MRPIAALTLAASILTFITACSQPSPQSVPTSEAASSQIRAAAQSPVERGRYLVTIGGCHDCHTPKVFTGPEPEPDMSRMLSGNPASEKLPTIPTGVVAPDKWGGVTNNHLSTWFGPWGVSFSANLTPDKATGLGSWTEEMFMKAIRTGKHQGEGRPILPPMPWQDLRQMTDEDLKAVFAFLQSIPPIVNAVPDPIPPEKLPK
jgi:mono/diheme cytochrome c family protein